MKLRGIVTAALAAAFSSTAPAPAGAVASGADVKQVVFMAGVSTVKTEAVAIIVMHHPKPAKK